MSYPFSFAVPMPPADSFLGVYARLVLPIGIPMLPDDMHGENHEVLSDFTDNSSDSSCASEQNTQLNKMLSKHMRSAYGHRVVRGHVFGFKNETRGDYDENAKICRRNACIRCHIRKTKCDGRLPTCGACAKRGTYCEFRTDGRTGRPSRKRTQPAQIEQDEVPSDLYRRFQEGWLASQWAAVKTEPLQLPNSFSPQTVLECFESL